MKKLIIAAAVAIAAVASNAATASWKFQATQLFNGTGSSEASAKLASGTAAYIFDLANNDVDDIFSAFKSGKSASVAKIADITTSLSGNGVLSRAGIQYGEQSTMEKTQTYDFVLAICDDTNNKIYLTKTLNLTAGGSAADVAASWGTQSAGSQHTALEVEAGASPTQIRWNTPVESVPEPTSAMLLLLGCAGLALKRKQK